MGDLACVKGWEQEGAGNSEGTLSTTMPALENSLGMGWVERLESCARE